MRNPDLCIVFNNGEISFWVSGNDYYNKENAINIVLQRWNDYIRTALKMADKPEELNFEIRAINIYELTS